MSKFRNLVENLLLEAKVYRLSTGWSDLDTLKVIKNPSANEYEQFKKNTKYNAIRGIVLNNNVYICDAGVGTHDILNHLVNSQILGIEKETGAQSYFEEDEHGNFQIRSSVRKTFPNLQRIFKDKQNAQNYENNGYFDNESEYNTYLFDNDLDDTDVSFEDWLKTQNK